jgi:hypothetical protein
MKVRTTVKAGQSSANFLDEGRTAGRASRM